MSLDYFLDHSVKIAESLSELNLHADHLTVIACDNPAANLPYHNKHHSFSVALNALEGAKYHALDLKEQQIIFLGALYHDFGYSEVGSKDNLNIAINAMKFWCNKLENFDIATLDSVEQGIISIFESGDISVFRLGETYMADRPMIDLILCDAELLQWTTSDSNAYLEGLAAETQKKIIFPEIIRYIREHGVFTEWGLTRMNSWQEYRNRFSDTFHAGRDKLPEAYSKYRNYLEINGGEPFTQKQIIDIAVTCSSAINIMRSSLDHAIADLAKENPLFDSSNARLKRAIKFPIHYSQIRFEKWRDSTIGGRLVTPQRPLQPGELLIKDLYGEDAINFLDSVQPYKEEQFNTHKFLYRSGLRDIAALDNYAKHSNPYEIVSFAEATSHQTIYSKVNGKIETKESIISSPYFALRYEIENDAGELIPAQYTLHNFETFVWPAIIGILDRLASRNFARVPLFHIPR